MAGDRELVERAKEGDRAAFAELVEAHYDRIYRFSLRFCGNRPDVEDISQQACVKLARSISQFRFESTFSTWLYTLVLNCARDFEKSQRRHRSSEGNTIEPESGHSPAVHSVYLSEVLRHIEQMGEGYKEAVVLVVGEGLSHAQAATILATKESTISWRLHEVRRRLNVLEPEDFDER